MVYYNNVISAVLLFPFCVLKDEFSALLNPNIMTYEFIFWNCVAGFLGFFLNFASLWCVSSTSATTYAIVGKKLSRNLSCMNESQIFCQLVYLTISHFPLTYKFFKHDYNHRFIEQNSYNCAWICSI